MRKLDHGKAIVLFSGGQDSSIVLAWALDRYQTVETIGFDYGQRHAIELGARANVRREISQKFPDWKPRLGPDHMIGVDALSDIGGTAMTSDAEITLGEDNLPTTFVPGRNLVFFALAAALAYRRDIGVLVGGMCETDYSGYPDCRDAALSAQLEALRLGMDADFRMETPLMFKTKAQSWEIAEAIGGEALVALVNEHSHTCYRGVRAERHDWGYGCGACPACTLRAAGWAAYRAGR